MFSQSPNPPPGASVVRSRRLPEGQFRGSHPSSVPPGLCGIAEIQLGPFLRITSRDLCSPWVFPSQLLALQPPAHPGSLLQPRELPAASPPDPSLCLLALKCFIFSKKQTPSCLASLHYVVGRKLPFPAKFTCPKDAQSVLTQNLPTKTDGNSGMNMTSAMPWLTSFMRWPRGHNEIRQAQGYGPCTSPASPGTGCSGSLRSPAGAGPKGGAAPHVPARRPDDAAGRMDKLRGAAAKPDQLLRPALRVLAAPISSNRNIKY